MQPGGQLPQAAAHQGKRQVSGIPADTESDAGDPALLAEAALDRALLDQWRGYLLEHALEQLRQTEAKSKVPYSTVLQLRGGQATPIAEHFAAFDEHLRAKGVTDVHREDTGRYLCRLAADCSFSVLADMSRQKLERWLTQHSAAGKSARARNAYRNAAVAFGNWCVEADRLTGNPFARTPKANEKADPRRQRRALGEAELVKLLEVARSRPVIDRMTVRRGKRKGQAVAKLTDATRAELDRLGQERALIYKTLVLTGLRKGELESLTVAQLSLDGPDAFAVLDAADEKNREGNAIALRTDWRPICATGWPTSWPGCRRRPARVVSRSRRGCRPLRRCSRCRRRWSRFWTATSWPPAWRGW